MSAKDCIKLLKTLDPEDADAVKSQQQSLVGSGVPGNEAWTQAAELVMETILSERNDLAAEIREKGGHLEDLTIENLLNPASYKAEPAARPGRIQDTDKEGYIGSDNFNIPLPTVDEITQVIADHPLVGFKGKVKNAYIVGSFAGGIPNTMSDVDVMLEVNPRKGMTEEALTEQYRKKLQQYMVTNDIRERDDSVHPQWDGRRVDIYFTYDAEASAAGRPIVKLPTDKLTPSKMERRTLIKAALGAAAAGGVARIAQGPTDTTTLGRAAPLTDEVVDQKVSDSVEKMLRADASLPAIMRAIAKDGPKELQGLATTLSKLIPKGVIKIVVDDTSESTSHGSLMSGKSGATMTLYTKGEANGLTVGTVLHESLHAAVAARYYKFSVAMIERNYKLLGMEKSQATKAQKQLENIWSEFKKDTDTDEITNTSVLNAYNSPDEFFIRALTDPDVQKFMAAKKYKGKTLLQRFIDWVKFDLFGYERTGEIPSWLDAALLGANEMLDAMAADDPNFAFNNAVIQKIGEGSASEMARKKAIPQHKATKKQSDAITVREEKTRLPGKVDIHKIGAYFDKLHKRRYRRKGSFTNQQDIARAKKHMADEVKYQLTQAISGKGWYDDDVHEAMVLSEQFVPGLVDNASTRQLMTVVSGILSNGNKANTNWAYATDVMRTFLETGKIETKSRTGEVFGRRGANIAKQLAGLGNAIDAIGVDATVEFLLGIHTGREIRAFKKKYWGTDRIEGRVQMDNPFFGARIFGPKIGSFALALNGVHGDDVVMDVWATRTMNRHMGQMIGEDGNIMDSPRENEREAFTQIVSEIAADQNLEIRDVQAILWYFEQQLFAGLGARNKAESFSDGARAYIGKNGGVQPTESAGTEARPGTSREEGLDAKYEIPEEFMSPKDGVTVREGGERDLLTATGVSGKEARTQSADTFAVHYEATEVGTIQSGVSHIKTHGDMAHLVAGIRKHAQETFMVVVTDNSGKVLNVIRHSIGTRDGASVYPLDVIGAIASTEGGTKYWFAHNHPSGVREASMADRQITKKIEDELIGMDVQYQGHVIIGDTGYSDVFNAAPDSPIPAFPRRKKTPLTERRLKRKSKNAVQPLTSPAETMSYVESLETETGLLLLDNRNRPVGVIALTEAEMGKLRDGKQVRRILQAIDKSNAAAAMAFNKNDTPDAISSLTNLGNYLANLSQFRVLDMVYRTPTGELRAFSNLGWDMGSKSDGFAMLTQKQQEKQTGRQRMDKSNHRRNVRRWLGKAMKRLQNRVPIELKNDVDEVDFDVPPGAAGFKYDGVVYLFLDNIRDKAEANMALVHEAIGHLGLEGSLGHKKFNELIGDVLNIRVEMLMDPGSHPEIAKVVAELKKHYTDEKGNYSLDAREEAREILAHIAHSKKRIGRIREIYNKMMAWMGEVAARFGLVDADEAHIETLLVRATEYIMDENRAQFTDREKGAAMVARPPKDPEEKPSKAERELLEALGLGGKETAGLWTALKNIKFGSVKEAFNDATARGYEGLFDGLIEGKRLEMKAGVGLGKETTYMTPKGIKKKTRDYANSFYVAARLATGISDMMTHLLNYGSLQWNGGVVAEVEGTRGFLDVLGELGKENLNDWLVWMAGNRAQELKDADEVWNRANPGKPQRNRENNLTPEMIALAQSKNKGKEELFTKIKKEYNEMNRHQLDFAEEAGLIDGAKRKEWESEWYVPFYRQTDEDRTLGPNTTRGLSHQSAGIRRLLGADVPTADLLENIMTNWIKLTDASVKNHALRTMVDNFQDTDYITNETLDFKKALIPRGQIHKLIKANNEFAVRLAEWLDLPIGVTADGIIDAVSDLDDAGLESLWQIVAPTDPDVVRVQRGGKNEYWRIHVPGLLRATGHINAQGSNSRGMRAARWFKTLLTMGVTTSPDFMMRNFIRDAAHSWAINKDNMWFLKDSFKGLHGAVTEGPVHRAMMAAGASFQGGYVHGTDPEATAKIMRRELIKSGWSEGAVTKFLGTIVDNPAKLTKVLGWGWQHYRNQGDRIENASRVATAQAGIDAGKPEAQWLFESKDLMDYSRRGNFAALIFLTDVMPFLNARVQGLDKLGRAWKEDKALVSKKLLMIGAFSVWLAMMNDDDDDYQELPDWEKDAYWHVFSPGPDGEKMHIRIPKPFEIGFIAGTMPERMYRAWVTNSQPDEKVLWAFQHGLRETLNINFYPQIILPVAEIKANRHFYFDQPIETLSDQNVVSSKRFNRYTSETAIALGDTALAKWVGMSPKQLQHLWNGYTGTMGAYTLAATDMMVTNPIGDFPTREEVQFEDLPLIKSLYKGDRKRTTQWQIDIYDRLKEVNELYGTLRLHIKEGQPKQAKEWRAEHQKKLSVRKPLVAAQKIFSKLRLQRDRILSDDNLSPSDKYKQSQAIQLRINSIAKKFEEQTRQAFSN